VRSARRALASLGYHPVLPCPQEDSCPVAEPDWCHFSVRLERSRLHRHVKSGGMGYEDEKFSYVVAAPERHGLVASRIVRHPRVGKGHIELELCTPDGLRRVTVSSSHPAWKLARKLRWGDPWDFGGLPGHPQC
jgi:ribosomal protein RSM22 (predicted rRNA methylase)